MRKLLYALALTVGISALVPMAPAREVVVVEHHHRRHHHHYRHHHPVVIEHY
jgi:hypothetical protein